MAAKTDLTTVVSTKGQVILPKAVRTRRGWAAGTALIVQETNNGVLLKAKPLFAPQRPQDVFGCLRYDGPARSIAEMNAAIVAETRRRHARHRY